MSRSESRRLTFWIAVYCLAFTVVLCALYFCLSPSPRRGQRTQDGCKLLIPQAPCRSLLTQGTAAETAVRQA